LLEVEDWVFTEKEEKTQETAQICSLQRGFK